MPQIKVYHAPDGKLTVRMPKGTIPDRATLEKVSQVMKDIRKSPIPCANTEQGRPLGKGDADHNHCTSFAALRQEAMEILSQLPVEDVEEITQQARDIIQGRA